MNTILIVWLIGIVPAGIYSIVKYNYNVPTAIVAGILWPLYFGLMLLSNIVKIFFGNIVHGCISLVVAVILFLCINMLLK